MRGSDDAKTHCSGGLNVDSDTSRLHLAVSFSLSFELNKVVVH